MTCDCTLIFTFFISLSTIGDITPSSLNCPEVNCVVTIQSSQGKYIETSDDEAVIATSENVNENAMWYIFFLGDNVINLKNKASKNYLSAWPGGFMKHNVQQPNEWERFTLKSIRDDTYSLMDHIGNYLSHISSGDLRVRENFVGSQETFKIDVGKRLKF